MEKPKLFLESWHFLLAMVVLSSLISIRLYISYIHYSNFISQPFYYLDTSVLNSYTKQGPRNKYTVLKLRADNGMTFFTTTAKLNDLSNKHLRVKIYPSKNISFKNYLGYFYAKSHINNISDIDKTLKSKLIESIASQHTNTQIKSFYNAIFLATPLQKRLRKSISALGVSHLVALSGFHLGILWGLIYGLMSYLYKPLQKRYFPYRYTLLDVGILTIFILGAFVWLVDFPPSLLRSYSMVVVGWIVVLLGIELVSFTFLTIVGLTLILLFPSLVASIGFELSIAGVFYIFLLLHYSTGINKWIVSLCVIPFGIFLLMLPIVHSIFGITTAYQLLSPLLSVAFILFYPLAILLHVFGIGYLLDPILTKLLGLPSLDMDVQIYTLPIWMVIGYIFLSIGAIWSRLIFALVSSLSIAYALYLFWA